MNRYLTTWKRFTALGVHLETVLAVVRQYRSAGVHACGFGRCLAARFPYQDRASQRDAAGTRSRDGCATALVIALFLLAMTGGAQTAFVYDTSSELLTSGDFNGDGITDVLVLDKSTGNARVGYLDVNNAVAWSAPLVTGVENVTGAAVAKFLNAGTNALAVTAPGQNRINLIGLSNPTNAGAPVVLTPAGIGPHTLATVSNPPGLASPVAPTLLVASSANGGSAESMESLLISNSVPKAAGAFLETAAFERGNALSLPPANSPTFAAGIVRGNTDRFDILQFTNPPGGILLSLTNLPSGSDYVFGFFNGEALPRIIFYQTGTSNLNVVALITNSSGLAFDTNISISTAEAVQHVFYLSSSNSGTALVQFADGVQALQFPGGAPTLGNTYRNGLGASYAVFTGVAPLASGQFLLLDAPAGSLSSTHAQVVNFDGTSFTQLTTSSLPGIASRSTRANLWLFQTEPFVNRNPGFIASYSSPDWSDGVVSLMLSIFVTKETDAGTSTGLNSPVTTNIGNTPPGGYFALANQYRDVISIFSYASPRPPEPVQVTISPSPGIYSAPVQISFSTLSGSDRVFYRAGAADGWHLFSAAFRLTNSATVQYYGTNAVGSRSQLLSANYFIASSVPQVAAYNLTNGTVNTNSGSASVVNPILLSSGGTIFYGRQNTNGGSLWAINLDGSGETYITTGARPRASHDGRYLAFSRGPNIFGPGGNQVWVRDLLTAVEWKVFTNATQITGYDWDLANPPNLILDSGCNFWQVPLSNPPTVFPPSRDCNDSAPVVNPVDGRLAFQNLQVTDISRGGIYVGPAGGTPQHLLAAGAPARWPEWSPDGKHLSYAYLNIPYLPLGLSDIYTISSNGTSVSQISAFTNSSDGFKFGTIWTPDGDALVGAGTINGTNGLWIIPLTADDQHCDCPAILLPTAPGDPIDFAGSIVVAPTAAVAQPGLFIRLETNAAVVYWSTNYQGFGLEYATNLGPNPTWTAVTGPYFLNGGYIEYHEARNAFSAAKYFRLAYPTLIFLTPTSPQLAFSVTLPPVQKAVLSWSTNYTGYTLETTTNLTAPVIWSPADGVGTVTNGHIEFPQNVNPNRPQQFFRLRWP